MRRPPSSLALAAGLCAAVLALAGCTGGPALGLLEKEQTEQDILTIQTDLDGIDLASTRFLAERDGVEYFAARPVEGNGTGDTVCLLVEEGLGVGLECAPLERGAAGAAIRDSRVTAVLLPDDMDRDALTDEGFELLHPNLAVRPAGAG
ncbi:hypothetical protein [Arthrobacter burdickii]|uniref:Lipoprotein n=1 Tax=Arthrobacter burdickii TaxID=3035920 RepID=A0ABT8K4M1_9MICC|nr:hypothetical protein [Arthrobacter burdickii]MDN4612414.1 hypothetical protein [Arthrobacter burdickii]